MCVCVCVDLLTGNISRLDLGLAMDVVGLIRHILWAEWSNCSRERLVADYVIPPEAFTWQMKHNMNSVRNICYIGETSNKYTYVTFGTVYNITVLLY